MCWGLQFRHRVMGCVGGWVRRRRRRGHRGWGEGGLRGRSETP